MREYMGAFVSERITTAGIWHASGTYFVAKRKLGGAVGNLWEFPGGKHRWGETPEESLQREFYEEFGVTIEVGNCFHTHDFVHNKVLYHLHAYWVYSSFWQEYTLKEHQEARWVQLSSLLSLPFVPSDIPIIKKIEELSLA